MDAPFLQSWVVAWLSCLDSRVGEHVSPTVVDRVSSTRVLVGVASCFQQGVGLVDGVLAEEQDIPAPALPATRVLQGTLVRGALLLDVCSSLLIFVEACPSNNFFDKIFCYTLIFITFQARAITFRKKHYVLSKLKTLQRKLGFFFSKKNYLTYLNGNLAIDTKPCKVSKSLWT